MDFSCLPYRFECFYQKNNLTIYLIRKNTQRRNHNMKNISEQYRREAVSKDKNLALWELDVL